MRRVDDPAARDPHGRSGRPRAVQEPAEDYR